METASSARFVPSDNLIDSELNDHPAFQELLLTILLKLIRIEAWVFQKGPSSSLMLGKHPGLLIAHMAYFKLRQFLHDPRIWNDPDEFRPERFLEMDMSGDKNMVHDPWKISFGFGRRCVIQTVKYINSY